VGIAGFIFLSPSSSPTAWSPTNFLLDDVPMDRSFDELPWQPNYSCIATKIFVTG
jgi:hypothetical protein